MVHVRRIAQIFELYLGLSRQTMPCEEAADVARIACVFTNPAPRPAPRSPCAREGSSLSHRRGAVDWAQLGFKAQPAFLSKFGKEEKRRVCLDVHQFVACISVCHSDHINHPKSKQIFTLMDAQRKGEVVLDDFVQIFESTGGAEELAVGEQKMLQQYIADAREK